MASGPDSKFRLEKLLEEAENMIRDVAEALPGHKDSTGPVDPGFTNSFFLYPGGHAYAYVPLLSAMDGR